MKKIGALFLMLCVLAGCGQQPKDASPMTSNAEDEQTDTRTFAEIPTTEPKARMSAAFRENLDDYDISDMTDVTPDNLSDYVETVNSYTQSDYEYIDSGKTYRGTQTDYSVVAKQTLTNADTVRIAQLMCGNNVEVCISFFTKYDPTIGTAENLLHQAMTLFARENILGEYDIVYFTDEMHTTYPRQYIVSQDFENEIAVQID